MAGTVAIINGRAGGVTGPAEREALERDIQAALPGARVRYGESGVNVTDTARDAVRDGSRLVIAGGGDGTVNAVACALAGSSAVLGVLPLGTLNHFARDVGIPQDRADALRVLAAGHDATVDVCEVNGHLFLNNSALGLYPGIVELREQRARRKQLGRWKRLSKMLTLGWATVKVLSHYRLLRLDIDVSGQRLRRTTPTLFVGNNEYVTEGLGVGSRERVDAGLLHVIIPHQHRALPLMWSALRHVLGRPDRRGDFEDIATSELRIDSHHHLKVTVDGELLRLAPPLHYRIRPGALRVLVPAEAPA